MSLRFRLIVAFFAVSVVPLGAVTFYSYKTSADALKRAAARETDVLAGELSARMQSVTTVLSQRVERLMEIAEPPSPHEPEPTTAVPAAPLPAAVAVDTGVAEALGELAMLLKNVELPRVTPRGDRDGRPPPPPPGGTGPGQRSGARVGRPGGAGASAIGAPPPDRTVGAPPPPSSSGRNSRGGQDQPTSNRTQSGQQGSPRPVPTAPPSPLGTAPVTAPKPPPAPGTPDAETRDRIRVDLSEIRRDILRQLVPDGRMENLKPDERARVWRELNTRVQDVVRGLQLGAAELQRQADQAKLEAAKAAMSAKPAASKPAAKTPPTKTAPPVAPQSPPVSTTKKTAFSGTRLDVTVEQDGKIVRQANAEVDLPNLLSTVFQTTHRDRGEVPFAVAKDGTIYTQTDDDRRTIAALGAVARPDTPTGTVTLRDWVVVTTADPAGSGLKLGIARPVGDLMSDLRRASARNAGLGLLFIGLALAGIVPLSGRLTRHLSKLTDGVSRIAHGDYRARVSVSSNDEVGKLALAFNRMAEDVEKHQRAAVEQERIKRELELGRQIQHDMLPQAPLRLGLTEIKGVSVPALEVGGDFFNYFELQTGQIALLMGDVSGKGVGAALLMANIQASLRTRLALGQDLSALAEALDRDIEANSPGPVYATLFVGILDPASRRLRYVNAGHHPQYVLRRLGGLDRMSSTGLPVGLISGKGFIEQHVQLAAGDQLFFYTDGCVEAESETGDMFGAERLEALLESQTSSGAEDLLTRVERTIKEFRGAREPFDDATMMSVKIG